MLLQASSVIAGALSSVVSNAPPEITLHGLNGPCGSNTDMLKGDGEMRRRSLVMLTLPLLIPLCHAERNKHAVGI